MGGYSSMHSSDQLIWSSDSPEDKNNSYRVNQLLSLDNPFRKNLREMDCPYGIKSTLKYSAKDFKTGKTVWLRQCKPSNT